METHAPKAVFLSYASQDAEAARRIRDALQAAGVEVWFDQSELRGGDAWDQKIRTQIKECARFLPIISAHTQERAEGYFRLEWKLARLPHLREKGSPRSITGDCDGLGRSVEQFWRKRTYPLWSLPRHEPVWRV